MTAPLADLRRQLAPFLARDDAKAARSLLGSVAPFLAFWAAAYAALDASYALTLALAVPAAFFMVRIFLLQHDCAHNALFRSPRVNAALGEILAPLTLTPFASWRRLHIRHHARGNDLDHEARGVFADCLTVREYRALPKGQRLFYRVTRSPVVFYFVLAPLFIAVAFRLPYATPRAMRRERFTIHRSTAAAVALHGAAASALGAESFLAVHGPVALLSAAIGAWFFAIQHLFEGAKWFRARDWSHAEAALAGASHLALPGWLDWLTNRIGYHHLHHLDPRIPSYNMPAAQAAAPALHAAKRISLASAARSLGLVLYDEAAGRMVRF